MERATSSWTAKTSVEVAVVGLGPDLIAVLRADELRADAETVAAPPHAALDHVGDVESAPDVLHVGTPALELEG